MSTTTTTPTTTANSPATYKDDCMLCKSVQGVFFTLAGLYHSHRARRFWPVQPTHERIFNLFAITVLFGIAGANIYAGYRMYTGQEGAVKEIAMRPGVWRRLLGEGTGVSHKEREQWET